MRRLLLLSTSTLHGQGYLEYAADNIRKFLSDHGVSKILFVPYALHDHDAYVEKVKTSFAKWGFEVEGIHNSKDPVGSLKNAQAVFVGGGNTFRLLKQLYDLQLIDLLKERVLEDGMPYIGSSAGTNIATINISTTNDMPIMYPPSLNALGFLPFNINPHYIDPNPSSTHMGETRETRIMQYHEVPNTPPVIGLREGSILHVTENHIVLLGPQSARLFVRGKEPQECETNSNLDFLLNL